MNEKVALYEEANKSIMLENRARKDIEDRDIYLKIKQDEKEKDILKFSILVDNHNYTYIIFIASDNDYFKFNYLYQFYRRGMPKLKRIKENIKNK